MVPNVSLPLRQAFLNPLARAANYDWESVARSVVAAFRADAARAGAIPEIGALVEELCQLSPDFATMWRDNDVGASSAVVKHMRHPVLGAITFECSTFAVDGRQDLTMAVHYPATPEDAERITSLTSLQHHAR